MSKPLSTDQFIALLEARVKANGWQQTADDLGVWCSTLQRVIWGAYEPSRDMVAAFGYRRGYRNGKQQSPVLTRDELQDHAEQLVRQAGSYGAAAEALGISTSQLWKFANYDASEGPRGQMFDTAVTRALGFSVVYLPKDGKA